ncbi:MAG TPA: BadF/BadG/BcrA/BcrD ATPase family protein [Candidatus Eremiobacteraceae bacterium]|nr:BadF/BadG/BcrA/BcrD ATPase family protein [Candidatus Eremiobacteraceae bacterium]
MTQLVAGIDGGQSSTVAVIGDEDGRILGRGASGPSDEIGVGPQSSRLHDALRDALATALRNAKLPEGQRFDAIVAGVSGYNGRVFGQTPHLPSVRFILMHDAPIAHAGALAGRPGVVVIAGTGSVVYTRDRGGAGLTLGGWGFLFGDEGSAFRIASDALAAMMRAEDEGDASTANEMRAACEFFGMPTLRAVGRAFYHDELSRDRIAAFAPEALRFERFRSIADNGADRLATLAARAARACGVARVALSGGVFENADFRARVRDGILATLGDAEIVNARYEPALGALLLAYRELGTDRVELRA